MPQNWSHLYGVMVLIVDRPRHWRGNRICFASVQSGISCLGSCRNLRADSKGQAGDEFRHVPISHLEFLSSRWQNRRFQQPPVGLVFQLPFARTLAGTNSNDRFFPVSAEFEKAGSSGISFA
jgi:hypothetical protein